MEELGEASRKKKKKKKKKTRDRTKNHQRKQTRREKKRGKKGTRRQANVTEMKRRTPQCCPQVKGLREPIRPPRARAPQHVAQRRELALGRNGRRSPHRLRDTIVHPLA